MKRVEGSTVFESNITQGVTCYGGIRGTAGPSQTTEANFQCKAPTAYTWSGLSCYVVSISGTITVRSRKNGANGNQVISATTTGFKEDATNTDSVASGDLINYQLVMSNSHSNNATLNQVSSVLDDGGNNMGVLCAFGGISVDGFGVLTGQTGASDAGEDDHQHKVFRTGTLHHFRIRTTVSGSGTLRVRKNGANGNQSVSYTSESGVKEDTTNTDSVTSGDLICYGVDSGLIDIQQVQIALDGDWDLNCTGFGATDPGRNGAATWYVTPCGSPYGDTQTEVRAQVPVRSITVFDKLSIYVNSNALNSASTFDFRANAASPGGGPSISISASQSGRLDDTSGTYTTAATDKINYRFVLGGTSGQFIEYDLHGATQHEVATVGFPFPRHSNRRLMPLLAFNPKDN